MSASVLFCRDDHKACMHRRWFSGLLLVVSVSVIAVIRALVR